MIPKYVLPPQTQQLSSGYWPNKLFLLKPQHENTQVATISGPDQPEGELFGEAGALLGLMLAASFVFT